MDDNSAHALIERLNALLLSLPESQRLDTLAQAHIQLFEQTGSIDFLETAIGMYEASIPDENPRRPENMTSLAIALQRRYTATRDVRDMDKAILLLEQVIVLIPETHPKRAQCLINLANALQRRNNHTEEAQDISLAIEYYEKAISLTPSDSPNRAIRLSNLAAALQVRFYQTNSKHDLDRAIQLLQDAGSTIPSDRQLSYMVLNNLAAALQKRSERTSDLDELDLAIQQSERALTLIPATHIDHTVLSLNLCLSLSERFERTGVVNDLDRAVEIAQQLFESTTDEYPDRAKLVSCFGRLILLRYEWLGNSDDLHFAISLQEKAVALSVNENSANSIRCRINLAVTLYKRYEKKGNVEDINLAISMSDEILLMMDANNPDRPELLNNLSSALRRRYERFGKMEDLVEATAKVSEAMSLVQPENTYYKNYLEGYANCLHNQFDRTGSVDDLDRAINSYEMAARIPENHPNRGQILTNFASALESRFERTGSLDDLDRAISIDRLVLNVSSGNHTDRNATKSNLALALRRRYERTGSIDDLTSSITTSEKLVTEISKDDPSLSLYLCNLGIALQKLFQETKTTEDLTRSVQKIEESIRLTPIDDANLPTRLSSLSSSLSDMYEKTNETRFLDLAIRESKRAVDLSPVNDVNRTRHLGILGDLLQRRFKLTKSEADFEGAIFAKLEAIKIEGGSPAIRISAADSAAELLIDRDPVRAKDLLEGAVKLFQVVTHRSLRESDRQYNISQMFGIASRAVSSSLQCSNDPYHALWLQELGRGVLANLRLDTRSDISVLEENYPEHAKRFRNLRDQLDRPQNTSTMFHLVPSHIIPEDSKDYRSRSKEFDDLIETIRALPGLDRFLLGPSESEIRKLAEDGPIVIFNISHYRSDVILVESAQIRSIKLNFTFEQLFDQTKRFLTAIESLRKTDYRKATREVKAVLKWLWDVAVAQVLDFLGFTKTPVGDAPWPRIWWVGNGLLNFLPLHAAGYHDSSSNSAIDRVISSYTPSIKAVMYARERYMRVRELNEQSILLVGMSETPNQPKLPFVKEELRMIQQLIPKNIKTVMPPIPIRETILAEIESHQIVHLSCHGDPAVDPSKSSLLLQDWQTSPLTVSDLTSKNLQKPQFAFLSACHTAGFLDPRLADESLTLTSAVSLAGFPSVVGTLWQMIDQEAADVSHDVYAWMLDGNETFDIRRSAEGLHHAVRHLRQKTRTTPGLKSLGPHDPIVWAPYIHVGV